MCWFFVGGRIGWTCDSWNWRTLPWLRDAWSQKDVLRNRSVWSTCPNWKSKRREHCEKRLNGEYLWAIFFYDFRHQSCRSSCFILWDSCWNIILKVFCWNSQQKVGIATINWDLLHILWDFRKVKSSQSGKFTTPSIPRRFYIISHSESPLTSNLD